MVSCSLLSSFLLSLLRQQPIRDDPAKLGFRDLGTHILNLNLVQQQKLGNACSSGHIFYIFMCILSQPFFEIVVNSLCRLLNYMSVKVHPINVVHLGSLVVTFLSCFWLLVMCVWYVFTK